MQYHERYSTEMKACSNFARLSGRIPRRSFLLVFVVAVVVVVVVVVVVIAVVWVL